jgi:hypothetical protein
MNESLSVKSSMMAAGPLDADAAVGRLPTRK